MKKIVAILAAGIAAAASAEVWYVPGWNRTTETNGLAYTSCTNVFKDKVCSFWGWDGDRSWSTSAANADVAAKRLADEIVSANAAFRSELVIVGHSLGGRIVARTLADLSRRGVKVGQGILLAPAIRMNDPDVAQMGGGCVRPAIVVVNPQDSVLKYCYDMVGGEGGPALGRNGSPTALANVVEYAVPKTITNETKIDAAWGRSETVKRVCNHLAAFYFTELRRILDGKPSKSAQVRVPQGRINLEWKVIDAGVWWDVLDACGGWKLERNIVTGHCRIISPERKRAAWGPEAQMRTSFNKIRAQLSPKALSYAAGDANWISAELAKPVLGADAGRSSWRAVLAEVERADAACDAAWRRMKTREELQQYGKDLRSRMIHAMGGFPSERCPLNARTVAVRKRDGYTVENVLFESWPGVHVSANLYLPDATRFPPPYPCVLISCGHSGEGKSAPNYGRGGVMSARAGIAALVVDPFAQGERVQQRGKNPAVNWDEHNRIGSLAVLLGGGFPRFRVWDAMRALDYLETRPDIDAKALGCMGNSGGGNVTAFLQAVDSRLAATAPAGYICSFARAAEKASIGPGDACQNIFGQLSFGLNHASFCLMSAPLPVRVQAYRGDIVFPFDGTRHTVELVEGVMKRLGWGERFGMTDMEGGHLWYEGSRASSIDWMKRWLCGDAAALARTTEEYRALNKGFDKETSDCGPGKSDGSACGGGGVLSLLGERTVYDVMRDDLKAAVSARKGKVTPADVRRIAGIAEPGAVPLRRIEISEETRGDVRIVREAYVRPDGLKLPAVVFVPAKISGAPVIALNAAARKNSAEAVAKYVAAGRSVMSIDLTGTGEIGQYGREKGGSYYSRKGRDEELSVLLYALGYSLVGRQAAELQEVALDLKRRFGAAPDIFTRGRMAVAAAHAFAVNKGLFGKVEFVIPPPSWSESVRKALDTPMSICVNGALLSYDWTELASSKQGETK